MKTYQKPVMIALSLTGNEQLCGTCADRKASLLLKDDKSWALMLMQLYGFGNAANGADRNDFVGVFGNEEQCNRFQIDGYCKFSSSGENQIIAWS